jgi:DNA-binding PadR family transcriptional regulator
VFHVLLALGGEASHGYAIMQAFEDLTGGEEQLLPGTLYATLRRMVEGGLLREVEPPSPEADARRRYYRVTTRGRALAAAESARMRRLLDVAAAQRLLGDAG